MKCSCSFRDFFTASLGRKSARHPARAPLGAKGITWIPMSARPCAVKEPLMTPYVWSSSCARCRGTACRPLVPHLPCGTPGRASPASRDGIHSFGRRLRLCDPEAATANSSWELTVGTHFVRKHVRNDVAQGPLSGLAALPPRRGWGGVGREKTDYLVAARQEPAPLEEPQGRRAGPALPSPGSAFTTRNAG